MTLKQILKKYPKAYIYYHDNGSWIIYKSKKDFERVMDMDEFSDFDDEFNKITLLSGDDFSNSEGYVPSIVEQLANALGLETGSA